MGIPQETRRDAYDAKKETSHKDREAILECLSLFGPQTVSEVAKRMGRLRYTIAPRFTDLQGKGLIAAVRKKPSPLGRPEAVWSAEPREPRADRNQFLIAGI